MAIEGLEQYLIQKPTQGAAQPVATPPPKSDLGDLEQYRIETPYQVRQELRPNVQGPVYNRENYQLPASNDPFYDSAKQVGFGTLRGAGGAKGNLLDLIIRGGSWVANKLGAPEEVTQQAGDFTRKIFNAPTSEDINQRFVDAGINPYAQTGAGRIVGQGAEAVGGAAALGVPPGALPAIGLGGVAGQGLREAGAPEWVATTADIGISLDPRRAVQNVFSSKVASSGLPQRGFSTITKTTKVSEGTKKAIVQNLSDDFKQVSNRILGTQESVQAIRNNPAYRQELNQAFQQVETLAGQIPETINTREIQGNFSNRIKGKATRGYADSEFEKSLQKQAKAVEKGFEVTPRREVKTAVLDAYGNPTTQVIEAKGKDVAVSDVVGQFRKNNQQLTEYFEPGKSGAANRAKKTALLEHNKAIADTLEKRFPNSEFVKTFKKSNADFEKLMQFEYVEEQIGKAFVDNKINFKQLQKQLDNQPFQRNLKGLIGEGMQKEYNGLIREFLSLEDPYKLLRTARAKGVSEQLITLALPYLLGPKVGGSATVIKGAAYLFGRGREYLLRNPKIITDWRQGIMNFKKGNYPAAIRAFQQVERQTQRERENIPAS